MCKSHENNAGVIGARSFFVCLFLLSCCSLWGQVGEVFKKPYPQRYQAVNDFLAAGESPERDLQRLDILMAEAKRRGDPKDIRNIQRAELIVKDMWHIDESTFMSRAWDLLKRAEQAKDHAVVGYVFETLGDRYYASGAFVKSFEYHLRAYEYYHNAHRAAFPDMAETQMNLAAGYFRFGDYSSALKYSKEIADHFDPQRAWITIIVHDLVGSSYLAMGMPDSAIVYFQNIFRYISLYHSENGRMTWEGVANGKIGLALFQKRQYSAAIPFLQKGVELCVKAGDASNTAEFSLCLYKIFRAQQDGVNMEQYFSVTRDAVFRANKLERFIEYFELMSRIKRQEGRAAEALTYIDSLEAFRDSLSGIVNVNKKYVAELDVARERRLESEKAAGEEKSRLLWWRNGLIAVAILLMVVTLFLYNRSLLRKKLHRQELLAEKRLSELELRAASVQLENIRKNLVEKNELLLQLETEKGAVADSSLIDRLRQSTILTDEQWDEFRGLFEKAHPVFLQQLKLKYPELSPSEIRFMVLAKLDYTNKDMAATLGVSTQAMRTTWYRIRKKLGLPEEGTLEEFIGRV